MTRDPRLFAQFRRLLLGIVVEILRDARVDAELAGLEAAFEPESAFRFTWVDNWMRFRGGVTVSLRAPVDDATRAELQSRFEAVWTEIVDATHALPLADRLTVTRREVEVTAERGRLSLRFDLEAD